MNASSEWHVFYIDTNNQIREKVNSNLTTIWTEGALNNSALITFDADQVGMSACLYGTVSNDSDYANRPEAAQIGIHLRYASDNHTMKQHGWREGDQEWNFQHEWTEVNPHADIGCNSWGIGTVDYIMLANQENAIEVWGKDTISTANEWANMTLSAGIGSSKVHPSTSFGYDAIFYAQEVETNLIQGYNISWAGYNTSILQAFDIQGFPVIPGTHLGATTTPNFDGSENDSLVIFYQAERNDISYLVRDSNTGVWSRISISIPDT